MAEAKNKPTKTPAEKVPELVIHLGLSPKAADLVKRAVAVEFDGPRQDDHSEEELSILEAVMNQINEQLPKPKPRS